MPSAAGQLKQQLSRDGFALAPALLPADWIDAARSEMDRVLAAEADPSVSIRKSRGAVYAARNVDRLSSLPLEAMRTPEVATLLLSLLGPSGGLVRTLYFDKPPGRSWSLPWHQDRTIAVAAHRQSERYRKPTVKAGVPHVEAPRDVLERMLTVRIHLDAMTRDNGPLEVVPGSHRGAAEEPLALTAAAGDALLMRPLLSHRSGESSEASDHRRVLHLEFASGPLDDGFQWHRFEPVSGG